MTEPRPSKEASERLAVLVRAMREQCGMSQQHLADAAGVARQTVSRLEAARPTSLLTLIAITQALGMRPGRVIEAISPKISR